MKIWSIRDSETQSFEGLDIADFSAAAYDYVALQVATTQAGSRLATIKAGPYVGSFPLLNGDTFMIQPRTGGNCFWRMLLVAEGLEGVSSDAFNSFSEVGVDVSGQTDWMQLLARPFTAQLRHLERMSLRYGRAKRVERSQTAKGRINPFATERNMRLRLENPVEYTVRKRTYHIPENLVLAHAARRLLGAVPLTTEDRQCLLYWSQRFNHKRLTLTDMVNVTRGLASSKYTGSRAYYIPPLLLAQLLLSGGGISFDTLNTAQSEAFLTNMRTLFEKYIRAVLSRELAREDFLVEKRASGDSLFKDGTCQLIPDVFVSKNGRAKLLVDAKYKLDAPVDPADYYQMQAYMQRYGVSDGLLVFASETTTGSVLRSRDLVGGGRIHELRLPLTDWETAEVALASAASRLLS